MGGVETGVARRVVTVIVLVALAAGCTTGGGVSPAPSGAPTGAASVAPVTAPPSAAPATPAPTTAATPTPPKPSPSPAALEGLSVRPFEMSVLTSAYFAVDKDGNAYLPGGTQGAAVVKMAPDGSVLAKWPGLGIVEGQPDTISGIAVDPKSGDAWVADMTADRIVRLAASDLVAKTAFGETGAKPGQLTAPGGLAIDPKGRIVVVDMGNSRLETFEQDGTFVSQLVRPANLTAPVDVAVDADGNLYISFTQPNSGWYVGGRAVKLTPDGKTAWLISAVGSEPTTFPDVAVAADGRVYVIDALQGLASVDPAKGTATPMVVNVPGAGTAANAVRVSPSGDVYTLACVTERTNCSLARFSASLEWSQTWVVDAPPTTPGQKVKVDDVNLYIQCVGSGSPTIVWSAGGGGSGWFEASQYLLGRLSGFGRVCTYDRAGLGLSDASNFRDGTHFETTVRQLHAALEAAGEHGPYVLVGYSFGGLVARLFALQYKDEVAGLVSVDGDTERWYDNSFTLEDFGGISPCDSDKCSLYPDLQYADRLSGGKVEASLGGLPMIVIGHDPAFASFGEADRIWVDMVKDSVTASSNAYLVVASAASHAVPYIRPGLVVEAVKAVVAAAKAPDHALAPCGKAMEAAGGVCN
jgi:sugar lactone lactonase YvrE